MTAVLASFALQGCKEKNQVPEVEAIWADMPENTNPNLKWMGFWGSDYDWREGEEAVALDKLIETNTTNIDFICGWTPDNVRMSVEKSVNANRKVFLRWHLGFAGYNAEDLQPKYKEFIDGYGDYVYGFYFYIDEPHWNGISMEEFTAKLNLFIRDNYPGKELLVVMAVAEFCPNAASLVKGFNKDGRFQAYVAPSDTSFNSPLENRTEGLEPGDDIIDILKWHWTLAQEYHDFEGICFYSWENGYYDTWGIALESFMREDLSYTADQFERAGDEYAGTYYREDLVKHFQQVCRALIQNNEHKPYYCLGNGEFVAWK